MPPRIPNSEFRTPVPLNRRVSINPLLYGLGRALTAVCRVICRGKCLGREHIPAHGPCLLMANHVSYLDPPAVGYIVPRPIYSMAKRELFSNPIFGAILRRVGAFPVERGKPDRAALRQALGLLAQGHIVLIFPEGRTSPTGELGPPEGGAGLLALMSSCPVIPVGLTGTDRVLPRGSIFFRRRRFAVRFGPPILLDDLRADPRGRKRVDEAGRRIMAAIAELIAQDKNAKYGTP